MIVKLSWILHELASVRIFACQRGWRRHFLTYLVGSILSITHGSSYKVRFDKHKLPSPCFYRLTCHLRWTTITFRSSTCLLNTSKAPFPWHLRRWWYIPHYGYPKRHSLGPFRPIYACKWLQRQKPPSPLNSRVDISRVRFLWSFSTKYGTLPSFHALLGSGENEKNVEARTWSTLEFLKNIDKESTFWNEKSGPLSLDFNNGAIPLDSAHFGFGLVIVHWLF